MPGIDGISILTGTSRCNADCPECAGRQHRHNAPRHDGEIDEVRLAEVLRYCLRNNCSHITLTGSGEPTLSPRAVTRTLGIIVQYDPLGSRFDSVNLYTNGIRIGFDYDFTARYLPLWKWLGLTSVYVSAYSHDEATNARAFRVRRYPAFAEIFSAIKSYGLKLRTSVILKTGYTDSLEKFQYLCDKFFSLGVDNVSAWPLKDEHDYISELAPPRTELERIRRFVDDAQLINRLYPGHTIRLLLGDRSAKKNLGKKIALFQDGTISGVWCARK